jgi:hypothetical protein
MPIIPAHRRLKQENHKFQGQPGLHSEFQARLAHIVKLFFKIKVIKNNKLPCGNSRNYSPSLRILLLFVLLYYNRVPENE